MTEHGEMKAEDKAAYCVAMATLSTPAAGFIGGALFAHEKARAIGWDHVTATFPAVVFGLLAGAATGALVFVVGVIVVGVIRVTRITKEQLKEERERQKHEPNRPRVDDTDRDRE